MRMLVLVRKFARRHLLLIAVVTCAPLLVAGSLYALNAQQLAATQEYVKKTAAENAKIDDAIKRIKQKKAEEKAATEAKAKAAAEAKKKAAAKAKAQAEAAKRAAGGATAQAAGPCKTTGPHSNPAAIDIVVNKKRCITPLYFAPGDLVTVYGAVISAKASAHFTAMYNAASRAGAPFSVTSSYRSYANQVSTYDYWVAVNGRAGADKVSARPGYSEHQTGFSVDLSAGSCALACFGTTPQYAWLKRHAASYGFIERYPSGHTATTGYSPEAWHYRYVGPAVAKDMKARGVKTLEAYWGLPGGTY